MIAAALLAVGVLATPRVLAPQAPCSGANHVTWPAANPVWDFCWKRPLETNYVGNGTGLEISNVRYNGTLVVSQAHLPILNVKYEANPSGCGGQNLCYRDWLTQEAAFQCSPCRDGSGASIPCNSLLAAVCTGTTTPAAGPPNDCGGGESCTVCDHPGNDAGDFFGVAVEDRGTSLRLTAQCQASWYRYIPVWEFFPDGTIQARFVATSIDYTCVAYTHHHQAYFRLDIDVNTSTGNFVDEVLSPDNLQRVATERNFVDVSPARSTWRVSSAGSPYVVQISRNPGDGAAGDPPALPNDFPVADGWVLAYNSNEIADYPDTAICAANLNAFDNNENVNGADVVLWVRAGALHQGEPGGVAQDCSMVGPTIRVLQLPVATSFHTLAPCRIVDTRDPAGPYGGPALQAGSTRSFVLAGRCGIPMTARSVAVNLTVTQPSTGGHVTAFPAGGGVPQASTINFSSGRTRANNALLPLGPGGAISVNSVLPSGTVHFILDVTGYFE